MARIHTFPNRPVTDEALADFVAVRLEQALATRDTASLVLSGGSTPHGFLHCLSQAKLPWARLSVTLADERWVPPEHPDSNARSLFSSLLQGPAAAARFLPLYRPTDHPAQAQAEVAAALAQLARPFDVVVLGMGLDGHTASLFPGAAALAAGLDPNSAAPCIAVEPPAAPHARLSLTRSALTDTQLLIVHITGAQKYALLQQALQPGPLEALPIRLALNQTKAPCHVFWAP